jgi:hypothetical protein
MDQSLIIDIPREKFVERCKQRAFDYLEQGRSKKRSRLFRRKYECPSRLPIATPLGNAWRFAANGERCARLEDADRRGQVMVGGIFRQKSKSAAALGMA